ncbi:MAG: hypothetical protein EHM17_07115 [Verrucomicrobiaceae bacterium]|nr:MAG: hypothetical protein EHM17_07115 [Verrucomicrobiaceae bacterium]
MKTRHLQILSFALALSTPVNIASAGDEKKPESSLEKITEFRQSEDDTLLAQQLQFLKKQTGSPSDKAKLICAILVEADKFLVNHERPKGTPALNIAPPGGGRSGVDPASVADPIERAAYQKLIDENKKLAETHRKHAAVAKIRDSAVNLLAVYRVNGLIDEAEVDAAIRQHEISEDQKIALGQLVKAATANKAQHPTDGAAEPEKPKE